MCAHACHSVLFNSLPYSQRQVVSLNQELDVLSPNLAGGSESPKNLISVPTSPGVKGRWPYLTFLLDAGYLNSGIHACIASNLTY